VSVNTERETDRILPFSNVTNTVGVPTAYFLILLKRETGLVVSVIAKIVLQFQMLYSILS
jgi:hypothetical protein